MKQFLWSNLVVGEDSLTDYLKDQNFSKTAFVISRMVFDALNLQENLIDKVYKEKDYKIVLEIERETHVSDVSPAISIVQEYQPDVIVAIGGGSVLDAAKLLKLFIELPHYSWADSYNYYQLDSFNDKVRLIAVPTTAGTGSEMTGCAMYVDENNQKGMFLDNQIIPDVAILDYSLIRSLPKKPLLYSAMDALTHALESATDDITDEVTQFLSAQSIVSIYNNLPKAILENDSEARAELMIASLFAGISINNSGCGLAHLLNYPGEDFHLPHGLITGLQTPYVLRLSKPHKFYSRIIKQLGYKPKEENHLQLSELLLDFYKEVGMPTTLKEIELNEFDYTSKIDGYIKRYFENDAEYSVSYQKPNEESLELFYQEIYKGVK